ncbi:DUF4861 domain-containing protein [Maribellus comscasis]|uniref:DUF4861 domain-containing protein n=1 Tax=Maribellus comscasis TaxID=2681766 RepID=A0A6I6K5E5_9BACT|nr:DUF4861 family protein [Maribellus comscasis]QGY47947.1 DUF4861 domain-containing protein [Maribellus comscasis]
MKNLILSFLLLLAISVHVNSQNSKNFNTQAYLGIKEGGEWVWVTKSSGKQQYEYQGGKFKAVTELTVDEKHTDHSFDIQFEGPGWESDKIGYRLYLDWRNAIDIFGKKTDKMVLHHVGLDGFDSYHEMQDWGVDVLKVGDALGIGSIAFWNGEKAIRVEKTDNIFCAVESGKKSSEVKINYQGWEIDNKKTDLTTTLRIEAGSYLTQYSIGLTNELSNLATGIVKLPDTEIKIINEIKPGWSCMITFGRQTLQNDNLGMCIFYKTNQLLKQTEDPNSHVLVLKPKNNKLTYYFGAAWEQDASGIKTMDDFVVLLQSQIKYLK